MNEKLTELKAQCGEMLRSSDVKVTTKMGRSMVHAYVSICLMSGRYEDLVT